MPQGGGGGEPDLWCVVVQPQRGKINVRVVRKVCPAHEWHKIVGVPPPTNFCYRNVHVGVSVAGIYSAVVSSDGRGVQRRRCALRRQAAAHEVHFCRLYARTPGRARSPGLHLGDE